MNRFGRLVSCLMGFGMGAIGGALSWEVLAAGAARSPSAQPKSALASEQEALGLAKLEPIPNLDLFEAFGKTPVLRIRYPWKAYTRASVEIRFFSHTEVDDERIQPQFVRARYWKGELLQKAYQCLLEASDVPVHKKISTDGLQWHLVADRSLLGRPALRIIREIPADPRLRTQSAVAVVYPLLEQWAEDDSQLYLELPGQYYSQPGQMRIWFLRDQHVVWAQKLRWPGLKYVRSPGARSLQLMGPPDEKTPAKAASAEKSTMP
ncbi:MAG: hypothetical protein NZ602_05410 [Thermoguttaceae bacterium]|nr:hypothetical protein [Thermoguttaceae bacterium]MDW8036450.1 hypothetical protein [Thermoguttaceae bacterium]